MQRNKVSIFNKVRLPFCAARLIQKMGDAGNPRQQRHFERAAT
jgi:hypothetical protein